MTKQLFWAGKKLDEPHEKDPLPDAIARAAKLEREGTLKNLVVPRILARLSDFGWQRGGIFMETLRRAGGMGAVDRALANPPATTEQVLHPEKYAAGEAPVAIDAETLDVFFAGRGLRRVWDTTLGELGTAAVLETHVKEDVRAASAGWGGDTLRCYGGAEGGPVIAWATAWDTAADAAEFESAAGKVAASRGAPEGAATFAARRGPAVALFVNLPAALRDGATSAAWKCPARLGDRVAPLGE
jgi:hypothetical protein